MSCVVWEGPRLSRASSAQPFPLEILELFVWCYRQWKIPKAVRTREASSRAIIRSELVMDPPFVVTSPCFFHIATCDWRLWNHAWILYKGSGAIPLLVERCEWELLFRSVGLWFGLEGPVPQPLERLKWQYILLCMRLHIGRSWHLCTMHRCPEVVLPHAYV